MSALDPTVRPATPAELDPVLTAYTNAFADEAVSHWVVPDEAHWRELATLVFRDFMQEALRNDEVLVVDEDGTFTAISVWVTLDSADRPRREASDAASAADAQPDDPTLRRLATVMNLIAKHHPDTPHVYLASMGVLPAARGRGLGGALLRHRLARADTNGQASYLEASTARSQALYERLGFESAGPHLALPEDGPVLRPMWRDPR